MSFEKEKVLEDVLEAVKKTQEQKAHSGKIHITAKKMGGSHFLITLPKK